MQDKQQGNRPNDRREFFIGRKILWGPEEHYWEMKHFLEVNDLRTVEIVFA